MPRRAFRLSPPVAGVLVGLLVGIADWVILVRDWGHSRSGMWYLPPFLWVTLIWTSITLCCLAGVIFSSPRLGRLRGVALAFAGPGLLLLIRGATPLRELTNVSTSRILLAWLIVTLVLAIPLAFLPMKRSRHLPWWLAGSVVSALVLIVLAAEPDARWLRRSNNTTTVRSKNVVLIFIDTARYDDALGGEHPAMPNLAEFARVATTFDSAWAPAPWTLPSHFSVLTGVDPWALPAEGVSPSFRYQGPMLAERFRAHGYDTAAILANPLMGNPDFSRGYTHFTASRSSGVCRSAIGELLNRMWVHGGPRSSLCGWLIASEVTARALRFTQSASRPYFLTLNFVDAHYPYYVAPQCRGTDLHLMDRPEREVFRRSRAGALAPPAVLREAHQQYRAAMGCLDRSLEKLLAALQRDPNTIVVILGDHGEQFGEHGFVEHGNSVYRQVLHVPLIVRTPGAVPARVTAPVSISDLYASLLRMAGVARGDAAFPIADDRERRPVVSTYEALVASTVDGGFSAVRGSEHFIRWRDGHEALFDDATDPEESTPLPLSTEPAAAIADQLRALTLHAAASRQRTNQFHALGYIQ